MKIISINGDIDNPNGSCLPGHGHSYFPPTLVASPFQSSLLAPPDFFIPTYQSFSEHEKLKY